MEVSERQGTLVDGPAIFPELQFMNVSDEALQARIGDGLETLLDVQYNLIDGSNMSAENRNELEFTINKIIKDIELCERELKTRGVE